MRSALKVQARFNVALNLSTQVPDLLKQGRAIVQAMSPPNTWFPSPTPTLTIATANLDALQAAEIVAETKAVGAVAARDAKELVVRHDLKHLGHYVEQVSDENPGQEDVIIKSAGMDVKHKPAHQPSVFRVVEGAVSGSVELRAPNVGARASHYWQSSTDQKTWTSYPETIKASTVIMNLTPATTYSFRHRVLSPSGMSDWDQIVSILVK